MVVACVKIPPSWAVPLVTDKPLFVAATTFTAGELVMPFTVLTKAPLERLSEWLLIIFTAVPVMPFIVVVNVLAVEVLATVLTLVLVAATPLTVLVSVLPDIAKVFVVAGMIFKRFIAAPVIPLL